MKKIHIQYLVLAVLIVATSCKKMIDISDPLDTITDEKIFNSDEQANQTIGGLYSQMLVEDSFSFGYTGVYGGLAADELTLSNEVDFAEEYEMFRNNILPTNGKAEARLWISAYKIIYTANAILDGEKSSNSNLLTGSKRHELKAHAKFVRAFCFFYLAGFYGNIPLTLSSKYNENIKLSKSNVSQVYDQLIIDLEESIAHFKSSNAVVTKAMGNQHIAEALLARVYLYKQNWEQAKIHADNVIKSGLYSLSTLANTFNKNSSEAIFQLAVSPAVLKPTFTDTEYFSPLIPLYIFPPDEQAMFLDPTMYSLWEPLYIPIAKLSNQQVAAFETNDKRASVWANFNDSPNIAPYNGVKTYYANKYPLGGSKSTSYMLIRLAEMYLIRAEALAMQDALDLAMDDVDKIRDRAGLGQGASVGKTAVLAAIAKERQTEFFAEWGHRFLDLKRTGKALDVLSAIPLKSGITQEKLDFPIPETEIIRNPRLKQNPGY